MQIRRPDHFHRLNIKELLGIRVEKICSEQGKVLLSNGTSLNYDGLVMATGARPSSLNIPGDDLPGVFTLRTYDDAKAIVRRADQVSSAVTVGGGLIALKTAAALKERGVQKVTVVIKSRQILSRQLDPLSAEIVKRALEKLELQFVFGVNPIAFEGDKREGLSEIILEDGSRLSAQLAVVGKGVTPNQELALGVGGKQNRGLLVDPFLSIGRENIFAAGDVIEVQDPITGEHTTSALWSLASVQGRVAGYNALAVTRGKPLQRYIPRLTRMNATEFNGIPVVSIGHVDVQGEDVEIFKGGPSLKSSVAHRHLVFKGPQLVGAALVGDVDQAGPYANLIIRGLPVRHYAKDLLRGNVLKTILTRLT
ncbi:NAD(P)/FAD-dependent oxidoreductase [Heliobacterium chlorum]|uniref:NAD(P)/FAD-dependent oxidoreductase n=1 Tax=Heliobacterium chlorum TaxID=2698 RepID=UPI00165D6048|nr:FAD-dependent oxidoreductase [Heliobacterium chlorum]